MHFSSPPRHVPLSLRIVNLCNGIAQVGWLVFGFSMIFVWTFVANGDYSFLTFRGPFEQATGRIVDVDETGASENNSRITAYHYEYSVSGYPFKGVSYSTSASAATGDSVPVEYAPGHPERSRVAGMRRAMFGPFVLFVLLFPTIALVVIVVAVRIGLKRNHVLQHGVFTTGTLKDIQPTNMRVNRRTVMAATFEFTGRDGQRHETEARTTDTRRLEDEAAEPLLYDPNDPTKAWMLDEAPARPSLTASGDLTGNPVRAVVAAIVPALVIAGNVLAVYLKFS